MRGMWSNRGKHKNVKLERLEKSKTRQKCARKGSMCISLVPTSNHSKPVATETVSSWVWKVIERIIRSHSTIVTGNKCFIVCKTLGWSIQCVFGIAPAWPTFRIIKMNKNVRCETILIRNRVYKSDTACVPAETVLINKIQYFERTSFYPWCYWEILLPQDSV